MSEENDKFGASVGSVWIVTWHRQDYRGDGVHGVFASETDAREYANRMNIDPSSDAVVFKVTQWTVTPNYQGEPTAGPPTKTHAAGRLLARPQLFDICDIMKLEILTGDKMHPKTGGGAGGYPPLPLLRRRVSWWRGGWGTMHHYREWRLIRIGLMQVRIWL